MVNMRLKRQAEVDSRSGLGVTALHEAIIYKHIVIVQILLDSGADIEAQGEEALASLHLASQTGNIRWFIY
jgi:ankyrin repeat protein